MQTTLAQCKRIKMGAIRAFFAIKIPNSLDKSFSHLIKKLKRLDSKDKIKWVKVNNLHITLQFLKKLELNDLTNLTSLIGEELKKTSSFQLEIGDLEWFPSENHPKVLSLSIKPHQELTHISHTIGKIVNSLGYPLENRPFRAHLTLGRLPFHKVDLESFSTIQCSKFEPILINDVYLFESRPSSDGTLYVPLMRFELT